MSLVFFILQVVALLFFAAFFSCTETAITSITNTEKHTLKSKANKLTLKLLASKEKVVSATLVGTNIVNNTCASIVTAFALTHFSSKHATTISTIIVSFLIIFFAEILPKSLATYRALSIIKKVSPILQVVRVIFFPVTLVLSGISNLVLKLLSKLRKNASFEITDEQLQSLIDISFEDGALTTDEQSLLTGAIRLRDLKLRNIITPEFELAIIDKDTSLLEAINIFCDLKFSRLPVCDNNDKNSPLGILHYKDLLFNENSKASITELMRPVYFLPESASVFRVISLMKTKRTNMVIAIDEYGHNVGLATMDDIIKAVFGNIQDEYDEVETADIVALSGWEFRLAGETKLYDLNKTLALQGISVEFHSDFYDTVAGLILENIEALPRQKERLVIQGIEFNIEKVVDRKIESILMRLPKPANNKIHLTT